MGQVNFDDVNYSGKLSFVVETKFDGSYERSLTFTTFDEFNYYLENYYTKNYKELFDDIDIYFLELLGVSFRGIQDSERFSVDFTDGWRRATIIFDERKFGDINIDKLKRIRDILSE